MAADWGGRAGRPGQDLPTSLVSSLSSPTMQSQPSRALASLEGFCTPSLDAG